MNKLSGLVIDDEKDIVETFSEFFELRGFNILGKGHNGCEAATMYAKFRPNFVVLDMKMPQYDGNHAINEIKKIDPDAKIFIVSGFSDYENLDKKVSAVFSKPCDMKQLVKTIESNCLV